MTNSSLSQNGTEKGPIKDDVLVVINSPSLASGSKRGKWASKWEYLLSLAGIAIGLGNVWRFPDICYRNGGGAFLVPYFLMLAFVGLPIFFLESSLGQFSSSGCISIYEASPAFKGIGYTSLLVTLIASTYYSVVIAYPLIYLYYSFWKEVPWASCNNPWNTLACTPISGQLEFANESLVSYSNQSTRTPVDEFFHFKILEISSGIAEPNGFVTPIVCAIIFVWIFVFLCIFKGVQVTGKVVWFTSTFPFVILVVLMVRGFTLPGAWEGIKYFIYPDFTRLANYQVWADAASQIFFSLQVGWGSIITLGSYNDYRSNSLRDALWIPVFNCVTSILAGFVVFSILGFMAYSNGVPISEVVSGGPALAFITYPEALAMMPWSQLWSVLFFAMLFFLGVDSCFCQVETMVASLTDEFPKMRRFKMLVSFILCFVMMIFSLAYCTKGGIYVLRILDRYSVTISISLACLAEIIVFAYVYGGGALIQDIQQMTNKRISKFWWICWMFFTPLALLLIVINNIFDILSSRTTYGAYTFPLWAEGMGWGLVLLSIVAIPAVWIRTVFGDKGSFLKRLQTTHSPTHKWGPSQNEEFISWSKNCSKISLRRRFFHPEMLEILENKGGIFERFLS